MAVSQSKEPPIEEQYESLTELETQMQQLKNKKRLLALNQRIPEVASELKQVMETNSQDISVVEPVARRLLNLLNEQRRMQGVKSPRGRKAKAE